MMDMQRMAALFALPAAALCLSAVLGAGMRTLAVAAALAIIGLLPLWLMLGFPLPPCLVHRLLSRRWRSLACPAGVLPLRAFWHAKALTAPKGSQPWLQKSAPWCSTSLPTAWLPR